MSRPMALFASAFFTVVLMMVIGLLVLVYSQSSDAAPAPVVNEAQSANYQQRRAQVEQEQAALTKREVQYQNRLDELARMTQVRKADYQANLNQAQAQIAVYQAQIDEIRQAIASLQPQIDRLEKARAERKSLFESQRREFETQKQDRLAQLQAHLDEGLAKLQEANAQLGRQ